MEAVGSIAMELSVIDVRDANAIEQDVAEFAGIPNGGAGRASTARALRPDLSRSAEGALSSAALSGLLVVCANLCPLFCAIAQSFTACRGQNRSAPRGCPGLRLTD
jgi:hypothetical protein